nr:AraC family transcriptional regulator [Mameliella sp. CS4]
MVNGPLHHPNWAVQLASYLDARGVRTVPLLAKAGFPQPTAIDTEIAVPFEWIAGFFELSAEATGDDLLGFRFGTAIDVRDAGLIAFLGVYAETMHEGIVNTAQFSSTFGDAISFDLSRLDTEGRLGYDYRVPISVETRQYVEWFASGCLHAYRIVMQKHIQCRAVHFRHLREHGLGEMHQHFGCTPQFGARENALYFSQADLATHIPSADDKLLGFLRRTAEDVLDRHPRNAPTLQTAVERALMRRLPEGKVALNDIAGDLGLSPRTLSRRLQDNGLTYRDVLNGLREALATRYLTRSTISQTQIAFMLGFSDQAAFVTAYRGWTGQTPGSVRRTAS